MDLAFVHNCGHMSGGHHGAEDVNYEIRVWILSE